MSPEIQWQIDQNDGMPLVLLPTTLRSYHQFLNVQLSSCCHKRLIKQTSDGYGIRFQFGLFPLALLHVIKY